MGRLQTMVVKWKYREYDRLLTEQFIGELNDKRMTCEIQMELKSTTEAKKFDVIWKNTQNHECETTCSDKCKYCGTGHAS